jgi:hypothetical protein
VIPQKYRVIRSKDGPGTETFLVFDSADLSTETRERLIIFSTERNLNLLNQCDHWFGDGTFKLTPPLFSQIYTIHGLHRSNVLPLVYVLMTNKSQNLYLEMFQQLQILEPSLNPRTMMTDFEMATLNAFHDVFPEAVQRGCFFHHKQCLLRKLQTMGEVNDKYNSDATYKMKVKMMPALAFIPEDQVKNAFEKLINDQLYEDVELEIINYYSDVWVLGVQVTRSTRRPPIYPPKLWNCYEAVKLGIQKTNNDVEGNIDYQVS